MRPASAPYGVLVATLAATAMATLGMRSVVEDRDRARMENAVQAVQDRIETRIAIYEAVLRTAADALQVTGGLSSDEFRAFVRELNLPVDYPGLQGMGFSRKVLPGQRNEVIAMGRAAGMPAFHIWPETDGPETHAILYLEPSDARNQAAMGYDMSSEPTRREAMERARDTGRSALSGRVELVQEIDKGDVQVGFLLYAPVYGGARAPVDQEERRERLVGFVYSPFRAGDLFRGVFGREADPRVAFRVYDGPEPRAPSLLYDSGWPDEPRRERTSTMTVGGRTWTLATAARPAFEAASGRLLIPVIAAVGLALAWVLFAFTRSLANARDEARRSEESRAKFYAAMSHEIRTPINAIMGYHDLLLEGILGPLTPEQMKGVERSQRASHHLREVVDDVLDLSKLTAGKLSLEHEEVDLGDLVEDLLHTLGPLASESGTSLEIAVHACQGILHTDPRRVRQILLNLVSNAVRFSNGNPVWIECVMGADNASVAVHDQGPGIPTDQVDAIFGEFVQLGSRDGQGTGLGLPISRRLADLLGGRIEVDSELGRGSTFTLIVPRTAP